MKLVLKHPEEITNKKLSVSKNTRPCLDSSWHYHSQYELIYISVSHGIRFVGDSVSRFQPGDLVLVGPYLPHLWLNEAEDYKDQTVNKKVNTIVIKFTEDFIGSDTFKNPEFLKIDKILKESKYGISFGQNISDKLHNELIGLNKLSYTEQAIKLLNILHQLSLTNSKKVLSSTDMRQYTSINSSRIDTVLKYISDNYSKNISLEDISQVACMTTNSFCRFFKKVTNKSFTQFLNEVRIRNASRYLAQNNLSVSEVSYLVGYNSITNFNKQFKQIMGSTPKSYREAI
ncbi:AraC family transcriptional regulator [Tenacibaculum sp. M341]|uniref:AraC family transcriptional regulator n=1 Tax=Tenacibaculum sp. M341 TaxID=2530339 RepID=UPI00104DFD3B|nr:AraC family transcriptional regulator [Tenacibaculum sp. M341]TCI90399.1 AraC family transcriptional regulator [Tenacibaculum sp. M341]